MDNPYPFNKACFTLLLHLLIETYFPRQKEHEKCFMKSSTLRRFLGIEETIPERGQSACLLKGDSRAVLDKREETLLNQASNLPQQWVVST